MSTPKQEYVFRHLMNEHSCVSTLCCYRINSSSFCVEFRWVNSNSRWACGEPQLANWTTIHYRPLQGWNNIQHPFSFARNTRGNFSLACLLYKWTNHLCAGEWREVGRGEFAQGHLREMALVPRSCPRPHRLLYRVQTHMATTTTRRHDSAVWWQQFPGIIAFMMVEHH